MLLDDLPAVVPTLSVLPLKTLGLLLFLAPVVEEPAVRSDPAREVAVVDSVFRRSGLTSPGFLTTPLVEETEEPP